MPKKVKELLADPNIQVNFQDLEGWTSWLKGCEKRNFVKIVQALLDDDRADYYCMAYEGSALDVAIEKQKNEAAFRLLILHPKIDIEKMGWSQMQVDFGLGDLETCKQYLKQFDEGIIDLNKSTRVSQFKPLHITCYLGHFELSKTLDKPSKD